MSQVFEFKTYTPEYKRQWDEFVLNSRNGTFLFCRNYMDYHSDRFMDASLIAFRKGKPAAILPACRLSDGTLSSHAGLTYGGWILPPGHIDGANLLNLFEEWIVCCRTLGYTNISYKPVPGIYHIKPSEEEIYALWRTGFQKHSVQLSSTIDLRTGAHFDMSKRQQVRKAMRDDVTIARSDDYPGFWQVLCQCLAERHEAAPVHSLQEIQKLQQRFQQNIKLYTLSDCEGLQAGVCIYDTGLVAHAQYGATTAKARERYYLTALYHYLINEEFATRRYFDFGTSNEDAGLYLNEGLLHQKFAMGGTGVVYEQYKLTL
ncbi:MAG: GNAT family N-acetyltransferase [Muribaculaceae bacterium]|nr:GNAT family N-acetyltransferase [Muribaculaceae bacterium]